MSAKIPVVDAREKATHDAHCFKFDEYEEHYQGCKYGLDEECPTFKSLPRFRVHFEQVNQMWLDVNARDINHAIYLAQQEIVEYVPVPDYIELPDGKQIALDLA